MRSGPAIESHSPACGDQKFEEPLSRNLCTAGQTLRLWGQENFSGYQQIYAHSTFVTCERLVLAEYWQELFHNDGERSKDAEPLNGFQRPKVTSEGERCRRHHP
jgi:hypothetical protein